MSTTCSLPPEIIEDIFKILIEPYTPASKDRILTSISRVSSQFSGIAHRLIIQNISIRDRKHMIQALEGIKTLDVVNRSQILSLKIKFQSINRGFTEIVPSETRVKAKHRIGKDQFIELINLLPNLKSLDLIVPTFIRINDLGILESLTSLSINSAVYDKNQTLLRQIIKCSPNLHSLDLSRLETHSTLEPLESCPPLKKLILYVTSCNNQEFIPSTSFIGLKHLEMGDFFANSFIPDQFHIKYSDPLIIPECILLAAPTLEYINLVEMETEIGVQMILPLFVRLKELEAHPGLQGGIDFLQLLPSSVTSITGYSISIEQLRHFELFPKPSSLLHISVTTTSCLFLLPRTLRSVKVFDKIEDVESGELMEEKLLKSLKESRNILPSNLKRIDWIFEIGDSRDLSTRDEFVEMFAEYGIEYVCHP